MGVRLVEKLWMISQAASTVLFPRVAAETEEEEGRKEEEGIHAACSSHCFELFLPEISTLQSLLVGIVTLSA
jgi:hypothetical protein